jgi:hypothetical protein
LERVLALRADLGAMPVELALKVADFLMEAVLDHG